VRIAHQLVSGDVAGGQLVALHVARASRAAGHEPLLVSPTPGPVLERAEAEGLPTCVVPLRRSFRIDDALRYARLLRNERAELLHTHTHFSGNVLARIAGRLAGVPVLAHMHIENVFRRDPVGRALQVALDDATARLCARILVVSEATRRALERQGYPSRRMEVVHNGVEVEPAQPMRLADGPTIVHVGRLAPVKGQRELIAALTLLENVNFVLDGRDLEQRGAYARELEGEAKRLGVRDRVVFAGHREDVLSLLAGCDVFALPSRVEGLPLVVLEAMAQARPVVATRVGGTPELVIDGETGILVPPGDVSGLARALGELLADPERARRLGEAGRARVLERFSAEAMTRRVLEVYDEIAHTMRL